MIGETCMEQIFTLLIVLAILLVIFLVCRELVCWYWKINEAINLFSRMVPLLESIKNSNTYIAEHMVEHTPSGDSTKKEQLKQN
jgi:hypothetical protein